MPKPDDEKKYVERDEIRRNPELSPDLRYVLVCADYIRPKFLSIPMWLVAAGPMGLNLAELRQLTELGMISCEDTLRILAGKNLVREDSPIFPGELSRWYPMVPGNNNSKEDGENGEIANPSFACFSSSSSPKSLLVGYSKKRSFEKKKPSERTDEKGTVKKASGKTTCMETTNDHAGIEIEDENPPEQKAKRSPSHISDSSNVRFAEPSFFPKKRKKLRLKRPESPKNFLSNDIKTKEKHGLTKENRYKRHSKNPSENPALNDWQQRPKPNRWRTLDWTGYWLFKWREFYNEEDPNFVGQTLYRSIGQSKKNSKGGLDIYWQTGFKLERFRDSGRTFKGNGIEVKEYIDWLFETYLPDCTWLNEPVSINQIFRVTGNFFLDKYKARNVKVKKGKKKGKGKRHHWGYSYDD